MKIIFILIYVFLFIGGRLFAKQIDSATAQKVGQNFLSIHKRNINSEELNLVYTLSNNAVGENSINYLYVFNGKSSFVIVSGDDNVRPILGYSKEGVFNVEKIPNNTKKWLEGYKKQIRYVVENQIESTLEIRKIWSRYLKNAKPDGSLKSSKNPLLSTQWDQLPYYNDKCPGGSVTGCVATAMAQVMKYWNFPASGSGFHSYDHSTYGTISANFGNTTYNWNSMPNSIYGPNDAIATLMYDCGVSVDMDYSPESSGAYVVSAASPFENCSEFALKTYFGYKNTLQGILREYYSDDEWLDLMKNELNSDRPILYTGFGSGGGHCFVADGYDGNDFLHFNWGWGGMADGYFEINSLNPLSLGAGGGDGNFNDGQQAIIGIEPSTGSETTSSDLVLYEDLKISESVIGYGGGFYVTASIKNKGTGSFKGDYAAAIFDKSNNFIDYIDTLIDYNLGSGQTDYDLSFFTNGLLTVLPGTYTIEILYRTKDGNWVQVSDNGNYKNTIDIDVINPNDIELNSEMELLSGAKMIKGKPASINLNIINLGNSTFTGQFDLSLFTLDGEIAQSIDLLTEDIGLDPNSTYAAPYLTFETSSIDVEPGTYLLALEHYSDTGYDWELTGSSYFQNPIKIIVALPEEPADKYEVNNILSESYSLPVSFLDDKTVINTEGSTIHSASDDDFYKVVLPSGYDYTFKAKLHDLMTNENEENYSVDALFTYSLDGSNWSNTYDESMDKTISLYGGGTLYFHVSPYFGGEKGTYLLDMVINRKEVSNSLDADIYEVNNILSQSFNLPISFTENNASVNTQGSNFHSSIDQDYYKIVLPAGYNYDLQIKLYDLTNSNASSYTVNGKFSYSIDGVIWSDSYDSIMNNNLIMKEGGVIYIHVEPIEMNAIGTYLLDVKMNRVSTVGLGSVVLSKQFRISPNPASNFLVINNIGFDNGINEVQLINMEGKLLLTTQLEENEIQKTISISQYDRGIYFIKFQSTQGEIIEKIVFN